MQKLELLASAATALFGEDPSAPSVVCSKLPNGKFYVSVVRYTEPFGKGKTVVHKACEETAEAAIDQMLQAFQVNTNGS